MISMLSSSIKFTSWISTISIWFPFAKKGKGCFSVYIITEQFINNHKKCRILVWSSFDFLILHPQHGGFCFLWWQHCLCNNIWSSIVSFTTFLAENSISLFSNKTSRIIYCIYVACSSPSITSFDITLLLKHIAGKV